MLAREAFYFALTHYTPFGRRPKFEAMKKLHASLLFITVVASNAWANSSGSQGAAVVKPDSSDPTVVKKQLLIRFKDEIKEDEAKKVLDKHSLKFVQKLGSMNLYLAEVAETSSTAEAQQALKSEKTVKYSEPNSTMKTFKK